MAEPTDITFKICNVRVNCRAVAIILNEGNILFQKRISEPTQMQTETLNSQEFKLHNQLFST